MTNIGTISQDQLDALFSDETVINLATDPSTEKPEGTETKKETKHTEVSNEIVNIDPDSFFEEDTETEEENEEETNVTVDDKSKDSKKETEEVETDEETKATSVEEKQILKRTIDFLVESGRWKDFEGREELEVDDEVFGKIALEQDRIRVEETFAELIDSTGPYGKAIISHIKDGGNPDDILDLFKEQKEVQSINTNTLEGKIEYIEKYYSEVVGWKPAKIEKHLRLLAEKGEEEIDSEFDELKNEFDDYYNQQLEAITQEREANKQKELAKKQKFVGDIKKVIKERSDFTDKDRKIVENAVLNYNKRLPNGQVVNEFFIKFAEMQNDPEAYVDLVLFTMDRERFKNSAAPVVQKKEAEKNFKFIKSGTAINKKTNSSSSQKEDKNSYTKTDFSVIFKK